MRKVIVVADSNNKNLRSVYIHSSAAGQANQFEVCDQADSGVAGEIETVQSVATQTGVKHIVIPGYSP